MNVAEGGGDFSCSGERPTTRRKKNLPACWRKSRHPPGFNIGIKEGGEENQGVFMGKGGWEPGRIGEKGKAFFALLCWLGGGKISLKGNKWEMVSRVFLFLFLRKKREE